jgi:putative transposase
LTAGDVIAVVRLSAKPPIGGFSPFGFSPFRGGLPVSRNYYAELNLHITWHTKDSSPLLVAKVEAVAHHALRGKCINAQGVYLHALGGIETHVHLCLSMASTITISEFIGQLKGASSHDVNQKLGGKVLEWQTGYGVVSFGTGDLEWVKAYVLNQRERHAGGRVMDRLERFTEVGEAARAFSIFL